MTYNWQQNDWPNFKYDLQKVEDVLYAYAERVGRVGGLLEGLPEHAQTETIVDMMVSEAIKTSEIEGEYLSRKDVMSSIKNNLGISENIEHVQDKKAEGAAALITDIRHTYIEAMKEEKLFEWHKMLMRGIKGIKVGEWRSHKEPMQVISGPIGKEKVHYEAPPSSRVSSEMKTFIKWFNDTGMGE